MSTRCYDVCVIGSGASGAVVASVLVAAGWDVIMVEQGEPAAAGTYLHDLIPGFETARARGIDGRWAEDGYPWTACAVGGGTRFYGGISLRFREVDFDASAHAVPGALPVAWPFSYPTLRPHYDAIEALIGVAGEPGADPLAPPSDPPPMPAHQAGRRGLVVAEAARRLGLRPFPLPLAVNSIPVALRPACRELTTCTDYACPIGAKNDVYTTLLSGLEPEPNFTLRAGWKAVRLEASRRAVVAGVAGVDLASLAAERITARQVVLAANAVQSAALLLRSRCGYFPRGLGNDRDMVGRGLCFKAGQYVRGWLPGPVAGPAAPAGRYASVGLSDYYLAADCPTGSGGMIYETAPVEPGEIGDGRLLRLECLLADQPMPGNRVLLDFGRSDRLGLPRLVMDYRAHPVDLERLRFLRHQAGRVLAAAGAAGTSAEPLDFTLGSAHLHGTCRMGTDPAVSVCDPVGRLHTADNVYVADGGLLPYPGGVHPTLTIQAVARHVAHSIRAAGPAGR